MKDLDRQAAQRSLDHNDAMDRQSQFSEWEDVKYGIGPWAVAILLIGSVIGLVWALWDSL